MPRFILMAVADCTIILTVTLLTSAIFVPTSITSFALWINVMQFALLWVGVAYLTGLYRKTMPDWGELLQIGPKAYLGVILLYLGFDYLLLGTDTTMAQTVLLISGIMSLPALLWVRQNTVPPYVPEERPYRRVLIIGAHRDSVRAIRRYADEHKEELELLGVIDNYKSGEFCETLNLKYVGTIEHLERILAHEKPDTLFILSDPPEYANAAIKAIEHAGCVEEIYVHSSIPLTVARSIDLLFMNDLHLLKVYSRSAVDRMDTLLRLIVNKCTAIVGLLVTFPLFLIIPFLIRLDSPGPALYSQIRVGRGGRPFRIYKFRSMSSNAEQRSGAVLAVKNDPRVTRVGRFMRATRIDELPQLINVLRGDMAIIGPRPERPEFQNVYLETIPWYSLRALCRPGITGLAQAQGDYDTSTQRKLLYDVSYLANISYWLDLRILMSTVVTVFTSRGH